jgi:hypothetical protein
MKAEYRLGRILIPMLLGLALSTSGWKAQPLPVRAQEAPTVTLLDYTLAIEQIGERNYVFARGLLRNEGPGPATNIQIKMTLWGEDPSLPLGVGGGHGWLDDLDVDESGPFSVAVSHCCLEDIEEAAFEISADAALLAPYRALRVEDVRDEDIDGIRRLAGDLKNIGGRYVNASTVDVYAAFFDGDELVRLTTANMPIFFDVFNGAIGQSFPPEHAYPWQITLPADGPAFTRYEVWSNGNPYPAGSYPVPLGFKIGTTSREDALIKIEGEIVHCGAEPYQAAAVVLKALGDDGRVVAFTRGEFESFVPLPPGSNTSVNIEWPNAPASIALDRIIVQVHAIANQSQRPLDDFCDADLIRIFLPRVIQGEG